MEGEKECAICMQELKMDEQARELECGHVFHEPCVGRWLEKHSTCPLCRFDVGRTGGEDESSESDEEEDEGSESDEEEEDYSDPVGAGDADNEQDEEGWDFGLREGEGYLEITVPESDIDTDEDNYSVLDYVGPVSEDDSSLDGDSLDSVSDSDDQDSVEETLISSVAFKSLILVMLSMYSLSVIMKR